MGGMNPSMKMFLMDRMMNSSEYNNKSEYGGGTQRRMIGYDREEGGVESRRKRDVRGRYMEGNGWENNRSYPRSEYDERKYGVANNPYRMFGNKTEPRQRQSSNGRYMMDDEEYDDEDEEMRAQTWYPPMNMSPGNTYGDIYARGMVYAPGAMNKHMGMASGEMHQPIDEHTAMKWVKGMEAEDGSDMPMFKIDQTEVQRKAICPDCNMWEYFVVMNMMYADYCDTAKAMNVSKPEFYARLAKNWLKDKDAAEHKLWKYMENVVK